LKSRLALEKLALIFYPGCHPGDSISSLKVT
jgi:hypothetical protein